MIRNITITVVLVYKYTASASASCESVTVRSVTVKSVTDLMPPLSAIASFASYMEHACFVQHKAYTIVRVMQQS
jgi:hypothetical protein